MLLFSHMCENTVRAKRRSEVKVTCGLHKPEVYTDLYVHRVLGLLHNP